jgi:hypothetical protein
MDLKKLTNRQLVELMAKEHGHNGAWKEFLDRFHKFVCYTIYKECKRVGYEEGVTYVEDIAFAVYEKLLRNNSEALKNFRSEHENAIYKYLQIIAIRSVLVGFAHDRTQTHHPSGGWVSLDTLAEVGIIPKNSEGSTNMSELKEEVEFCLQQIFHDSRHQERDMLIFKFYFFGQLKSDEITSLLHFDLSTKRVSNIIADNTPKLRKCLIERGIGQS